jgi:(3,5-dihydroxyphenyl)acetyl-CoA 1,2-dioxygenase
MEGSGTTRTADINRRDINEIFRRAGLPAGAAAAWVKTRPRVNGALKRDSAAGTKFWQRGTALLEKLPSKPRRTPEQQLAADIILSDGRRTREEYMTRHAEAIYRKLTRNLSEHRRVDELTYAAAKLVPGLTPNKKQVDGESALMQSEKDGVEVDQGIFLAQVLAVPDTGLHLCEAMLMPKPEALERSGEFIKSGVIDFGPARVERQGKAAVVTVNNPRFLNAEDDDTLDDTETAADIAILDPLSEICVLRGTVVDHPKYKGRKIFSAGINLTHLYRGKIPFLWYIRRDMGVVNKMLRGLATGDASPDEVHGGTREKP